MSDKIYDHSEPWDSEVYRTGSTKPPKSHSGLIAVLLVAVIFLAGISSLLGIMNVKLFKQLQNKQDSAVDLTPHTEPSPSEELSVTESTVSQEVTIVLDEAPESDNRTGNGLSLQEIYKKCIDSVVSISCQSANSASSGTGVVVSQDGYIVTNCHVVENAKAIAVQLTDQRVFQATVIGTDVTTDLAVLHIDAKDLVAAEFGSSDSLQVGDAVCAIGDPLGVELRGTMTDGIVSAINRDITTGGRTMTLIQTNAALNSGNSGGPLINSFGQIIGINTMKIGDYHNSAGVEGLGFAIPSTTVKEIVDQLIQKGYVSGRPYLGITGETVSTLYQYYYRLPKGIFITDVDTDSDAAQKGLQAGDILVSIDGKVITSAEELATLLYNYQVGDTIEVVIYRNNRSHTVELLVEEATGE